LGDYSPNRKSKAYDELKWVKTGFNNHKSYKHASRYSSKKNVEFPEGWSLNAINIVAQKYFCGTPGAVGTRKLASPTD
jgi:hypothetical protein